jgi:hypothetical protein
MPLRALIAVSAFLMASIASQNTLFNSEANTAATSSCDRGACTPATRDADSGTVLGHEVLSGGCLDQDLHVMRYVPGTASAPLVATWCD